AIAWRVSREVCVRSCRILFPVALALSGPVFPQWLNYPTPGIPRLPDGKPNLSATAPRRPDGKPDLSGLWEPDTRRETELSTFRTDVVFPPEWFNVGAQLKDGLPFRPWARDLRMARKADNSKDSPDGKCLPMGLFMDHSNRSPRKMVQISGLVIILY